MSPTRSNSRRIGAAVVPAGLGEALGGECCAPGVGGREADARHAARCYGTRPWSSLTKPASGLKSLCRTLAAEASSAGAFFACSRALSARKREPRAQVRPLFGGQEVLGVVAQAVQRGRLDGAVGLAVLLPRAPQLVERGRVVEADPQARRVLAEVPDVDEALDVGEQLGVVVVPPRSSISSAWSSLPMPLRWASQASYFGVPPLFATSFRHFSSQSIISWKCSACFIS